MIESGLLLATYYSEPRSAVYLFADSDGADTDSFITLFSHATEYQIAVRTQLNCRHIQQDLLILTFQLNLIGVGNTICTDPSNNGQFPKYLESLASMTSGFVYMTAQVDKVSTLFLWILRYQSCKKYEVEKQAKWKINKTFEKQMVHMKV